MALVAWHHVERCARVSLAAAFDFTSEYAAPPFGSRPYLGNAPEAGRSPLTRTQGRRWRRSDASNATGRTGKRPERFGPPGDPTAIPRRGRATMPSRPGRAPPGPAAEHARRATSGRGRAPRRKRAARRQREEVRKHRPAAPSAIRRALQVGILSAVAVGAVWFFTRAQAPGRHPAERDPRRRGGRRAERCRRPSRARPADSISPQGEPFTYDQHPATSGRHDPSPLPPDPHVYTAPVDETAAVHNLEHAYVLIYYRADGPEALPTDVVDGLATLAESEDKVIMAPHPSLDEGTSLALTAWNKLWECPAGVTADQARTIASGFIEAYRGIEQRSRAERRLAGAS